MKTLTPGYHAEVDQIERTEWSELLSRFEDAILYQTWSYGALRWGVDNISHLVLRREGEIVAAAQSRIMKLPVMGRGIAYITWGPVWRLRGKEKDLENLRQMIRALREEYAVHRGLLLRVLPNEIDGEADTDAIRSILQAEGFRRTANYHRTLLLDLAPSKEQLRKNLAQRWRRELSVAERKGLKLLEGTGDELYEAFSSLYDEMLARKKFVPGVNFNEFRVIQKDLPDPLKMKIMVCEYEGQPVAGTVSSLIGNTGIYLLGATGNNGTKVRGSYLLQWRMIEWLKDCGARWYDLNGIDPEKNPGTYHFKVGISRREARHIGQFDACQSPISSLLVKSGDQLRATSEKIKSALNSMRLWPIKSTEV
jgi:lipid II:glycine glycyltransferase (peptidoglycan interpeptide bridge formation enzyme)